MRYDLPDITLAKLANVISAELVLPVNNPAINEQTTITKVANLEYAGVDDVTFLGVAKYKSSLLSTKATAVILSRKFVANSTSALLVVSDPRVALEKVLSMSQQHRDIGNPSNMASQQVNNKLGTTEDCKIIIHPTAVVGRNCQFGSGVIVGPHAVISDYVSIGTNSIIGANVVIGLRAQIGKNCQIKSGAVIGESGFGFARDHQGWHHLPHLGRVVIGNAVFIGNNTTIDRGMLHDTIIGSNVIIDNQVQIAHGVIIGDFTAIAGCCGIAGSVKVGKACLIGGGCLLSDHIEISDGVVITGGSVVHNSLRHAGEVYSATLGAKKVKLWHKNAARFHSLDAMAKRIQQLEERIFKHDQVNERADS